jgi:K+-sensing histidine kinase KdpD
MVVTRPEVGAQRLVRRGWRTARRLGADLDVVSFENGRPTAESEVQREQLHALAVTLGAHFAVVGRGEGAAEIVRMAEERGVTRVVMRAPRPGGLLGRLRKDLSSEILEGLEGVDLFLLADRPDEPKGSGE